MAEPAARLLPPVRPEFVVENVAAGDMKTTELPLSTWRRLGNIGWLRKALILVVLALLWEAYARYVHNTLMFPSFTETMAALWKALVDGPLLTRIWITLKVLMMGYAAGVIAAALLTTLAVSTRIGSDLLTTLTAMFNPLPAIALLPLSMLWFGLGVPSLIFVIVHSVLWAVALNAHTGFRSVSETLRMAGANFGLKGVGYVTRLLIPAAFPSILSGLKIGWAFAWRTLIAAELVFGVSTSSGGLGWFIFENRNLLETASVFAGLTAVIIIGLLVESIVFQTIERHTVRRWGMQR
jgi:NitT/TauT family transport system permease protein